MKNLFFAIFFGLMTIGCGGDQFRAISYHGYVEEFGPIILKIKDCTSNHTPVVEVQYSFSLDGIRNYVEDENNGVWYDTSENVCFIYLYSIPVYSYYWITVMIEREPNMKWHP